ncbi:MAG: hypothetical protein ABJA74_05505 [Lapillicoccus sp.]
MPDPGAHHEVVVAPAKEVVSSPPRCLDNWRASYDAADERGNEVMCVPLPRLGRVVLLSLLAIGIAVAWTVMMDAAQQSLYVEPTDVAVGRAQSARSWGLAAAVALLILAITTSAAAGRAIILVLGLPAALCAAWWWLAPDSAHSAVLLYGVGGSLVALLVLAASVARSTSRDRRSAKGSPEVGR